MARRHGERGVVAITGAGETGMACAEALGGRGCVLLGGRSSERLASALQRLRRRGVRAEGVPLDVTDRESVSDFARSAAALGPLAALVHTAGLSRSMADGRRIMAVNHVGTALVLDAFIEHASRGSAAACIASIGGHREALRDYDDALLAAPDSEDFLERFERRLPLADRPAAAYDLSKRGVMLLVRQRARAWGRRGARIVSISPGVIDTEMGRREGGAEAIADIAALGRIAAPAEIASVVEFVCSQRAGYVTGCDIQVDGGTLAGIAHDAPPSTREAWNRLREEPA